MAGFIVVILVGIACIALGISNTKGKLESLHYYHRHRVSEENRLLLGKTVGCGMIIFGLSIVAAGVLFIVTLLTGSPVFTRIGTGIIIAGFAVGIGLCFYAIKKYNKGIF